MPAENSREKKGCLGWVVVALVLAAALALWTWRGHGPLAMGLDEVHEVDGVAQVQAIVKALNAYAADHGGSYPQGSTSTEVFQKLLDAHYVTDPKTFFVLTGGKFPADSGTLESENVCFDLTAGASAKSPDDLPLVFTTGYAISYTAGVNAKHATDIVNILHGLAVGYKNGSAHFRRAAADGSVPDVIPTGFDAKGETYRQLTP